MDELQGKVLNGLEKCKTAPEFKEECEGCPYDDGKDNCIARMAADALEMLKAQEPRVMTLDEIMPAAYGGRMYWLELHPGIQCHPVLMMKQRESSFIELAVLFDKGYGSVSVGRFKPREYNVFWRCWTEKPTDEQREATPWGE